MLVVLTLCLGLYFLSSTSLAPPQGLSTGSSWNTEHCTIMRGYAMSWRAVQKSRQRELFAGRSSSYSLPICFGFSSNVNFSERYTLIIILENVSLSSNAPLVSFLPQLIPHTRKYFTCLLKNKNSRRAGTLSLTHIRKYLLKK